MDHVGKAIRQSYYWLKKEEHIFLIMDNVGGHGTKKAIKTYRLGLRYKYNISIIHQSPRSPFTNLLDLGVWCSMQSYVEKQHFHKRKDVNILADTVMQVWNNHNNDLQNVINKVYNRLRVVLALVVEGKGGNDLVETKRGKQYKDVVVTDIDPEFFNRDLKQERVLARNAAAITAATTAQNPAANAAAVPQNIITTPAAFMNDFESDDDDDSVEVDESGLHENL